MNVMIAASEILNASILIVDDQAANILLLEQVLRNAGYRYVSSTMDPRIVCSMHATHRYDLILLDLQMPEMDGFQVMQGLQEIESDGYLPVLVITAQPDHKLRALQAGAKDFVSKPFDLIEVQTRIHNMLEVRLLYQKLDSYNQTLEQTVLENIIDLRRFRMAMDTTADAIFLLDRSRLVFVDVNDSACRMLGYSRAELLAFGASEGQNKEGVGYTYLIANESDSQELSEMQLVRKDGSSLPVEMHRQTLRSGEQLIIVAVVRDISERKSAEQRLQQMAHYDTLTGLPNRTLFYQILKQALAKNEKKCTPLAVLFVDLDNFKNVNDTRGHAIGDELLRQFTQRLRQCVCGTDTVGRLGGDEFAMLLALPLGQQDAVSVANKIRETLRGSFDLQGYETLVTASIGITVYPDDAQDTETLIKYADTALYQAKEAGRDTYRFFTSSMNERILERLALENALRKALDNQEFVLYFQPKVQISSGRIVGAEALIRWNRPGHGLVSPNEFIPFLEEGALILRVGTWVIASACEQIARWKQSSIGPIQLSVNVSSRQFIEGDLEADVVTALRENAIEADFLELELTEGSLMSNAEKTIEILHHLKTLGVQISIDDFGTGYSSLAYLKRFPIDKLKIDIAFIRDVITNPDDAAITLAIINMAHSLKLEVIAEGVETEAQLAYLRKRGCDYMQGFYFSRPVPAAELERMLLEEKCLPMVSMGVPPQIQTLLIVDDEASVLHSLKRLLGHDGYRILTARTASAAFEQLALHPVQIVLCDQRLSGMSGIEFLDRVKDLYPDSFRIVLSGYADVEFIMNAINCGSIYRVYTKPWDKQQLRNNLRAAFMHYARLHDNVVASPGSVLQEDCDAQDSLHPHF